MYLDVLKTDLDEKRALANAVELSRAITTFVPSVALVETLLRFDDTGVVLTNYCYPREGVSKIQSGMLSKILLGSDPFLSKSEGKNYTVLSTRNYGIVRSSGTVEMDELYTYCKQYAWFAPVELRHLSPSDGYDLVGSKEQVLSIRVPSLIKGERLIIQWENESEILREYPHICNRYIGKRVGEPGW